MEGPDKFSHEWYRQQLNGITHLQRLLSANQEDQWTKGKELAARVEKLETENRDMRAKIGELIDRLDKAAIVVRELSKKNGTVS